MLWRKKKNKAYKISVISQDTKNRHIRANAYVTTLNDQLLYIYIPGM